LAQPDQRWRSSLPCQVGGAAVNPEVPLSDLQIAREYNAASDFIDRNVAEGRGSKVAVRETDSATSYGELASRMNRVGNALRALGVQMEQRVLLCMLDTADLPAVFWGAIKIGAVPVPVNTLLSSKEYDFLLRT
jgi:acyl-coenzyme A synthetase/AMP-(fatty) acid ligase